MEIGEGISITDVESDKGIKAIHYVTLKRIYSLHVHDNSCILAVTPKRPLDSRYYFIFVLEWCRVERCPKLETVSLFVLPWFVVNDRKFSAGTVFFSHTNQPAVLLHEPATI